MPTIAPRTAVAFTPPPDQHWPGDVLAQATYHVAGDFNGSDQVYPLQTVTGDHGGQWYTPVGRSIDEAIAQAQSMSRSDAGHAQAVREAADGMLYVTPVGLRMRGGAWPLGIDTDNQGAPGTKFVRADYPAIGVRALVGVNDVVRFPV